MAASQHQSICSVISLDWHVQCSTSMGVWGGGCQRLSHASLSFPFQLWTDTSYRSSVWSASPGIYHSCCQSLMKTAEWTKILANGSASKWSEFDTDGWHPQNHSQQKLKRMSRWTAQWQVWCQQGYLLSLAVPDCNLLSLSTSMVRHVCSLL